MQAMAVQSFYLLFGIIAILGGALGFARAKSRASLIAGAITGALLIIAGLVPVPSAFILALVVSAFLLAHFGRSYLAKRKPMPAIPMIILSVLCIVWTVVAWLD
jgi:uncharacterized membrane protein (UPF0136 family)